jgi:hypothetical protein
MAATSPYSPNDYQAVSNYRPYELPINDIFKAISAQNAFWDAGAARVKAKYEDALNLKLSLEPNKAIRDQYLKDAEKQLTKLSSGDLANPAVQRQGFALFKPLFQDEGIIYDDLTTRHYDKVRNDALTYRNKDNGKGFSDINFQYAMQGYSEFLNSKDRMAGKGFYESRKEYTPYYDYTEDFSKALKDCKPSSVETTSPQYGASGATTGYLKETYSRSLSAAQVQGCLGAGLSPNGQRQMQIEGAVMYKNNLPVLASDTATYLGGVSTNLATRLQQLSASKAAILSKKDISDKEKAVILEGIDNEVKGTTEELEKTNHSVSKILNGDYTDIQNNYDTYAGSVYSYKKLYKKALSSAFEETKSNYKADPVQLSAIKFQQDKYLNQMDIDARESLEVMKQNHDSQMKLLDLMYGGKDSSGTMYKGADIYRNPLTGEITVNPNLMPETPNITDKPDANQKIYQQLTDQVTQLNNEDTTNNLRLYNNLISRAERDKNFRETLLKGFNYGVTDDEWARFKGVTSDNKFTITSKGNTPGGIQETSWFKAYTQAKPDDEDVNKWSTQNTVIETGVGVLNRKLELGEAQVARELGITNIDDQMRKKFGNTGFTTKGGQNIRYEDFLGLVKGSGQAGPITGRGLEYGRGTQRLPNGNVVNKLGYYFNGEEIYDDARNEDYIRSFNSRLIPLRNDYETTQQKLNKKRVEVYNKLGFDREPWYFTPSDDKKQPPLVQTLRSVLPKDEKGKDMDVSVIASDFAGGVRVSIPGAKPGSDFGLDVIRKAGVGTSVEATGDNIVTIRGTTYNLVPQAINNPVLGQAAFQLASVEQTQAFAQTQPGAKVPNTDIKIPVMIRGKQETMTIETYKNDTRPEYRVYVEGAKDPRPIITAGNAYELFEKIGRSPMDLNKPINR